MEFSARRFRRRVLGAAVSAQRLLRGDFGAVVSGGRVGMFCLIRDHQWSSLRTTSGLA